LPFLSFISNIKIEPYFFFLSSFLPTGYQEIRQTKQTLEDIREVKKREKA
jgi:hypothetical protein